MKTIVVIGNSLGCHIAAYLLSRDNRVIHIGSSRDTTGSEHFSVHGKFVNGLRPFLLFGKGTLPRLYEEKLGVGHTVGFNQMRALDWAGGGSDLDADIKSNLLDRKIASILPTDRLTELITTVVERNAANANCIQLSAAILSISLNKAAPGGRLFIQANSGLVDILQFDALFYGEFLEGIGEFYDLSAYAPFLGIKSFLKSLTAFKGPSFMTSYYEETNVSQQDGILAYKYAQVDMSSVIITTYSNPVTTAEETYFKTFQIMSSLLPTAKLSLHFWYCVHSAVYWNKTSIGARTMISTLKDDLTKYGIYLIGIKGLHLPMLPGEEDLDATTAVLAYSSRNKSWKKDYLHTRGFWR